MFRETEITNFKGMNRSVGASNLEAHTILNLDPRGRDGELTNSPGFVNTYPAPSYANVTVAYKSHIGLKTFFMSQFDKNDQREVTLIVQKGVVSAVALSGIADKNLLVLSIRPYWNGVAWVDDWQWINEVVMTDILTVSGTQITLRGHNLESIGWVVENTTKNEFAKIVDELIVAGQNTIYNLTKTGWAVGDKVTVYRNYIPMKYLEGMFNSEAKDISFHNVLNDLRFACGGDVDKVGLSIGYRARTWDISNLAVNGATDINGLIVDPYFPLDDNGIYGIDASSFEVAVTNSKGLTDNEEISEEFDFFYDVIDTAYFVLVANLDSYNSYKVAETKMHIPEPGQAFHIIQGRILSVSPKIKYAEMNKRITSFDLYMASGTSKGADSDYGLVKSFNLLDYKKQYSSSDLLITPDGWSIKEYIGVDTNGYLIFLEDYTAYDSVGGVIGVETRNISLRYSDWIVSKDTELHTNLGYFPTMNYVKSWDMAVLSQNRTHLINGYIDQRYENMIFISPFGGTGAAMVDVITTGNFLQLESRDGNNVVGNEVLPNMDLLILKQNSKQIVDTLDGAVRDLSMGKGATSRYSIINFGDKICWANEYGIIVSDGINDIDITKKINELYEGITNKDNIMAVREEKWNGYRFNAIFTELASSSSKYALLYLDDFGWLQSYLAEIPIISAYDTNKNGNAIMLDHWGKVWTLDYNTIPGTASVKTQFTWQSVPMDISLLGQSIKDTNRIILGRLWISYEFSENCTFNYRIDGGAWESKTIPSSKTHFSWTIPPGVVGRTIEIAVNGFYHSGWSKLRIKAIGLLWDVQKVGRFG